jgi:hypothetical protein
MKGRRRRLRARPAVRGSTWCIRRMIAPTAQPARTRRRWGRRTAVRVLTVGQVFILLFLVQETQLRVLIVAQVPFRL